MLTMSKKQVINGKKKRSHSLDPCPALFLDHTRKQLLKVLRKIGEYLLRKIKIGCGEENEAERVNVCL